MSSPQHISFRLESKISYILRNISREIDFAVNKKAKQFLCYIIFNLIDLETYMCAKCVFVSLCDAIKVVSLFPVAL